MNNAQMVVISGKMSSTVLNRVRRVCHLKSVETEREIRPSDFVRDAVQELLERLEKRRQQVMEGPPEE